MNSKLPKAFLEKLSKIYSKEDIEICNTWFKTEKRKTTFRVNTLKTNNKEVENILKVNWLEIEKVNWFKNAYILKNGIEKDLWNLDFFKKWYIYLQSISSQIPVEILNIKKEAKVLDITSAPGWKTSQAAAKLKNTWEIIANELNAIRIDKLNFTLNRQWVKNTKVIKNDARKILENYPIYLEYFDYIIADLPCSAEWKFNIKNEKTFWFWNEQINKKNYRLQKQIINSSLNMIKIWWILVYSTCTISPEENEWMVHNILCNNPNFIIEDINLDYKYSRNGILKYWKQRYRKEITKTKRILTSKESEWFFIAKFKRIS